MKVSGNNISFLDFYLFSFYLDRIPTLVDLSAKTIARHIPFELVERYNQPEQPVPENLQLKIAFWSFPDGIEDIR
jgi:hypothetical protein